MMDCDEGSPRSTSLEGLAVLNRRHWHWEVLDAIRRLEYIEVRRAIVGDDDVDLVIIK